MTQAPRPSAGTLRLDFRLLARTRAAHLPLAISIAAGAIGGILLALQARAFAKIVAGAFLEGLGLGDLLPQFGLLLLLSLLRAAVTVVRHTSAKRASTLVKSDLRTQLVRKILSRGPQFTAGERGGELVHTLQEGVEALDAYLSGYLPHLTLALLVPLTLLLFILPIDPISGVVLLLTAPLIPLFMILIGDTAERLTRRQWHRLSHMSGYFLDALRGLTTLKIFDRSRAEAERVGHISEQFRRATMNVLRVSFLSALTLEMLATLSVAVIAVQAGLRLLSARIPYEQAFLILILAPEFYLPLRALGARFHTAMPGLAAADRIFEILAPEKEVVKPGGADCPTPRREIRFERVIYQYPDRALDALHGISFTWQVGTTLGIVGPSGSGKSTLIDLLLRFMSPQSGQILIDGGPLDQLDPACWRRHIAWVPQRPYFFHGTVADNLRLARPQAAHSELVLAAKQAHADEFIRALPDSYDTLLGERGARLSAGQAQRLALARAFFRAAPLAILDEATAHLDPESEALLQDSLSALRTRCTLMIVAHRLRMVVAADEILVLGGGQILEQGSHEALLGRGGLYARLWHTYGGEP